MESIQSIAVDSLILIHLYFIYFHFTFMLTPQPPNMTASSNTTQSSDKLEEILVLYGSQTGNSEGAAQEICSLIPTKLKSCTSRVMHLDDFLELEKARWTRLVVIVCSSYGVGQAPIGARKFRELCDEILLRYGEDDADNNTTNKKKISLEGVHFALLGLGDSHYTTYFQNPTTIHNALTMAGATHVGKLGKADASGRDEMEQIKVIDRWIATIWDDLARVIATTTTNSDNGVDKTNLDKARGDTWELCLELYPEWNKSKNFSAMAALYLPLVGIVLALLAHFFFSG